MEITMRLRELSGVAILDMSGRITLGDGSVVLRETVREQISSEKKALIINLGEVTYMDSSGLGELISAFTKCKESRGDRQALESHKTDPRPDGDYQALHRLRHIR
jgi:anti-sigma B factor antagonist